MRLPTASARQSVTLGAMVEVTVVPALFEDKPIMRRLRQLYLYDFSEFTGEDLPRSGEYHDRYFDLYWVESSEEPRYPFFVMIDGQYGGFAWVRFFDGHYEMAEFFVMRKYRRQGAGAAAASAVFARFPGNWRVRELATNRPAQAFWPRVIEALPGVGDYRCGDHR